MAAYRPTGGCHASATGVASAWEARLIGCRSCGPSALFLASDDASFMTGAYLVVDGGYTAR